MGRVPPPCIDTSNARNAVQREAQRLPLISEAGQRLVRQLFFVADRQVLVASAATWATVRDISLRHSALGAHPVTPEVG